MDYLQKYKPGLPANHLVELAKKAKADKIPWVQKALIAAAITEDTDLTEFLVSQLKLLALVEELDPFPFAAPTEEDFLG